MKKIASVLVALLIAMSIVSTSSVFADEVTPTPTMTTEEVQKEETTSETEASEETEVTITLSEEATAFIQSVNDAENNKENILNAAQEYVDELTEEKEEAFFNLFDQGALLDAYDVLSEEDKNNEEVINAKAILDALVLSVDTIMNTEEPNDEPTTFSAGVTLGTGTATTIDMSLVTGDVVIKSDGLYINGSSEGETTVNPDGYEFSGTSGNYSITVSSGITSTLFLNNLVMNNSGKSCIVTTDSFTTIVLKDNTNNILNIASGGNPQGVIVKNGYNGKLVIIDEDGYAASLAGVPLTTTSSSTCGKLTITANGTHIGTLGSTVTARSKGTGEIYILGGNVSVTSSKHMPAIGAACGSGTSGGITKGIYIERAYVYAKASTDCAAIGSGAVTPVDGIYITNGAQVIAVGGPSSPGIGSGGSGPTTAWCNAAATGSGAQCIPTGVAGFNVSNVEISGGTTHVWATGDQDTKMPGIGCGRVTVDGRVDQAPSEATRILTNVSALPDTPNWATYIKYGTSATNFAYTTALDNNGAGESLATPISTDREFATFLQKKSEDGVNVFYTEVYFGLPHDELGSTDKADIGANNYGTCSGSFNWADTTAAKTQLLSLAKVSGHDQNGNLLSETDILNNITANDATRVAFEAQIQAIFNANTNKDTGNYPLTFTYNYTDADDNQPREMSVTVYIQFRDACSPTQAGNNPTIAASNAVHPTGGAAFSKAQLIGLTEGTASNYLGLDADLVNDITLTQADVDKINAAKVANQTGIFPLTYTYVTTTDGTTPVTLTKTVYVTLTDTGTPFTPKDPNHPEKGQNMGPQFGGNDYITKTGGAAFDTTTLKKIQNVSAKDSNGTSIPLDKLIPDPTQLAAINAAKTSGQVGDFPLKYTFEDVDGTIREVETTVSLRDNEGTPPTTVEKKDDNNKVIGYVISTPELGSNDHTTPTGGTGWTEDEIKDLLDVIGKDANGTSIPRTDFTVDPVQLAKLNDEKLAGKCGRYPITFTEPNGDQVIAYVTLNGCVVPKPPVNPGPWLVTYVDCKGNTVKVEWVGDGYNSTKPNANYSDVNNVHFNYTAYPNNCGVGYKVPNTGVKDYSWIYYVVGGVAIAGIVFLVIKSRKKE